MLRDYLSKTNVSVYKLAKDISEPYSTINDISNGKVNVDNCRIGVIKKMANYFNLSLEQMCEICNTTTPIYSEEFDVTGTLYVKNRQYFLQFVYAEDSYDFRLCKVLEHSTLFIKDIAKYEMEEAIKHKIVDNVMRKL